MQADSKTSLHGITSQDKTISVAGQMDPTQHLYFIPEDWMRLGSSLDAQKLGAIYTQKHVARLEFATRADAETWKSDDIPLEKRILPKVTGVQKNLLPKALVPAAKATRKSQI